MENRDDLNDGFRSGPPPAGRDDGYRAGPPPRPLDDADGEPPLTIGQWLGANGFALTVVAIAIAFVIYRFRWEEQLSILKAALGLSFVVFIHELGHFLVAKWCDVHVTTFSIGFGPAIPGCSYQWGETTYKLSLLPLGGYVQMVGQVDGDEGSDGSEEDPRSYRNKSVGQRMAIISAGVIMNVILAVICFVAVFQGPGKERHAGVVGQVDTGAPAFKHGVRTGAEILRVGDVENPHFESLMIAVMGTGDGEELKLVTRLPGQPEQKDQIEPRLGPNDTKPVIGVGFPNRLELAERRYVNPDMDTPADPGSAAARAVPAFAFGDDIIAMTDSDNPAEVTELPPDPRASEKNQRDYFEFARRMQLLAGQEVTVRVRRGDGKDAETVDIKVPPQFRSGLGVRMQIGPVTALRLDSPAVKAGIQAAEPGREGDLIEKVEVPTAEGGWKTLADEKNLDPEKLPLQLKLWARELAKKADTPRLVRLTVRQHRNQPGNQYETKTISVPWDDSWRFDRALPMSPASPLAIPELGLAYQVKAIVAGVDNQAGKLQKGDVIKNLRYTVVEAKGEEKTTPWLTEDLEEGQWAHYGYYVQQTPREVKKVLLKVQRGKNVEEVEVVPTADAAWPINNRGLILMQDTRQERADNFFQAVALGMRDTYNSVTQVFQNLRGMLTQRISVKMLGGPVMIANAAYRVAGFGFWEFVFFLGLISVNLAVVNFLPIPVLDGGHMVFLLYEKLRGKPASEAVRVGATYAGLALILSLFLFVMYLDVMRLSS